MLLTEQLTLDLKLLHEKRYELKLGMILGSSREYQIVVERTLLHIRLIFLTRITVVYCFWSLS